MSILKSFDDNSIYENVLPYVVFDTPQYVDTDTVADVRKCIHVKIYPYANNPELRKVFHQGDTHADIMTMQKVRLSSIYGEQKRPEA